MSGSVPAPGPAPALEPPPTPPWAAELWGGLSATPTPVVSLVADLRARGHADVTVEQVETELQCGGEAIVRPEGVIGLLAAADGVVLTHVVDPVELDLGVLTADGDLDLWARLADEGLPLAGGGEVHTRWAISGSPLPRSTGYGLVGPPGWLDHLRPGVTAAVRLTDGQLRVDALAVPPGPNDHPEQLRTLSSRAIEAAHAALEAYLAEEESWPGAALDEVVADLVVDEPRVLRDPVVPLTVLLEAQGLEQARGMIGLPGVPLGPEADEMSEAELRALVAAHTALVHLRLTAGDQEVASALLLATRHEEALESAADAVELDPLPEDAVALLLDSASDDDQRASALLLASRAAEGSGEHVLARARADEAARLRPDDPLAVWDAAMFAAAAGQARVVDDLLRGLGEPADDPVRISLRRLLVPPVTAVGRNRPCPCGSGRKAKVCCQRTATYPLPDRAELAYVRLLMHSRRPGVASTVDRFALVVDEASLPLAMDLALFDGGVVEDYVRRRGHLLAADEVELLQTWRTTPLAPYEVDRVEPHHAVTLRPLLGGEPVVLRDRAFSTCGVAPLDVLLVRPLWNGERFVLLSLPVLVHRMRRADLLRLFSTGAADPDELAAFFGPQPPPVLRTRDGESLVFCEAAYTVSDATATSAWQRLAESLSVDDEDDDVLLLLGREVAPEEYLNRGTVRRHGSTWTISTNSRERMAELRDLVQGAAPEASLVSESEQDGQELAAAAGPRGAAAAPFSADVPGLSAAEQDALVDDLMRRHEQAWVDEAVPALGGLSPREAAAAGGVALAELEGLLDDMAWMRRQARGGMDADRIRLTLGLPVHS